VATGSRGRGLAHRAAAGEQETGEQEAGTAVPGGGRGRERRVASGELRRREGQRVVGRKKMEKETKKGKRRNILRICYFAVFFAYLFCTMYFRSL
jgi:hypothetical protein